MSINQPLTKIKLYTYNILGGKIMSFGLVLSGGGAKGAAHIGVLKALEENNLIPSAIAGTSIGSIVGGLYSIGYNASELEKIMKNFSKNYYMFLDPCYPQYARSIFQLITRSTITMSGLIRGNKLEAYLKKLTKNKHISETNIRFIAPCVDLITSNTIAYTNKIDNLPNIPNLIWKNDSNLAQIMRASSSIPAIFYPKKLGKSLLIDGGITNNLPINLLYMTGEKNILAIDLSEDYEKPQNNGIFELLIHSFEIMQLNTKKTLIGKEKLLISIKFPNEIEILDFRNMSKLIKIGYEQTNDVMPQIKEIFK